MKSHSTDRPARKTGAAQAVVTLFGTGGRRCRLAAAFVAVMVGLMGQTASQAFAQAKETVLYLDAPAVSTDRATRAGETASAYSDTRSPASPDTLAWLGVQEPRGDETEAPPQDASDAFASVTTPDARGTPDITAEAAYDAGATMLAQIGDGPPTEDGVPGEGELAATGAVRPELGDGTQAPGEEPSAGYGAAHAGQPTTPDLASSPEPVAPVSEPVQEPSGGEGLALEAPASALAPTELAAAPTDDASPAPEVSPDTRPDYGATGPISEPAVEPALTAEPSTDQEVQEQEVQEQEVQEPEIQEPVSPSGDEAAVLETPDSPEPDASPAASGEASASLEPAVEPSTVPTAEWVEEPEGGSEEFAGANTTPVAGPEPADETAHGDPSAALDTGSTSGQSGDVAFAPTSSPVPVDDGDPVSASPAAEEAGQDDALENVSREQVSEIVIVQESDTGEGAAPTASPPPDFAPPTDEAENNGAEDTGPPSWAPPSDETQPETAPTAKLPAEQFADDGAEEGDVPSSEVPNEQPHEQTDPGSGETATSSPADDAEEPAPDTPHGTGPDDEGTVGVSDSPPSEEALPKGADQEGGQDVTQDPGSGEAPTGGSASPGVTPSGDPQAPPDTIEQALPPGGNAGTNGPRSQADGPAVGSNRGPDRSREDRMDDSGDRHDRGHSSATSPDEHLRRIQQDDGGAESVQEKARESTGRPGSGSEQQSVTKFQVEGLSDGQALKLPTSTAPRKENTSDRRKSAQDRLQSFLQDPALDLDGASLRRSGVTGRVDKEPTPREQRSRAADASNPEDAEEASEGSHMERQMDRRSERREARRAERFATRVAERKAKRREGRVAAGRAAGEQAAIEQAAIEQAAIEQAAVERAAVSEQRRQNRLAAGGAFDAQGNAAPSAGRRRNASDYQETVPTPAAVELAPVQHVGTQRFTSVEQPAAVKLPPVRQVQPQTQVWQQFGSGGDAGQVGGGVVARATKSVNRPSEVKR